MSRSVPIQLDKPRTLILNLETIEDLERALEGKPLGTVVQDLGLMGVTTLSRVLWAALKTEDKSLHPNLVRKILQTYLDEGGEMRPVMDAVSEAINECGLFKKDGPEGNTQAATVKT